MNPNELASQEHPKADEHGVQPGRRRRKRGILLGGVLVVVAGLGVVLIGRYWLSRSFAATCRQAAQDKDWSRVEQAANRWLSLHTGQAAPWIFLAEAAQEQGDLERAVACLDKLPDADPLTPAALLEQSTWLFGPLNRPLQGAASCERALQLNPRLPEAYRRLIYFYAYTLQRRQMVRCIYSAIANDCDRPETYLYLIAQDWLSFANAYQENTKWLKTAPNEELFAVAQTVYGIKTMAFGNTLEEREKAQGKIERHHKALVDKCFARFPKNLELLVYYLQTSSANGDIEEVTRLLSLAPPQAVEDGRFWRYKGWLHSTRGELNQAVAAYRKALELNPYDPITHHQFATVERRLSHKEQVETLENLATEGQELRRVVILLPDVTLADRELLQRIAKYCADCGDGIAAAKLQRRLERTGF